MIVSWNWLSDYVKVGIDEAELVDRLSLAGLNHEGTESVGDDLAIDLEVTSNRPDWLGHIGVAREIAVLLETELVLPTPDPEAKGSGSLPEIRIDCPELCRRYTARLIRGCKIGPSPAWLQERLATLGIQSVNNVVDATNYVMMECGQPLHAFDADKIKQNKIVVREARKAEPFVAIDHRTYELTPGMCVIADAEDAVALGGVMGGAESEVSETTANVLLEAADFDPIAIRTASRALNLHSPSSYRFERSVDPVGIEWASLRCCELILQLAGGELIDGMADAQPNRYAERDPITLRFGQIKRLLGIDVPPDTVHEILVRLGNEVQTSSEHEITVSAPSWRHDLTREVDLIEEVARIYGYEKIPEDVGVSMVSSSQRNIDRVMRQVRTVTAATGFDEAMTCSVVTDEMSQAFSPWTDADALKAFTPMLRGASNLRRSLLPSLLEARRVNESLANPGAELFEVAKVYLPRTDQLPDEPLMLSMVSGRDFHELKGAIEAILRQLHIQDQLTIQPCQLPLCTPGMACELSLAGKQLGYLGSLSEAGRKQFKLRAETTVAELKLEVIEELATLVPQHVEMSSFPSTTRDLNLVLDEAVRWDAIATTVRDACGATLENLEYMQTYRDPKQDGEGKKRLLFRFQLRSHEKTLTGEEADQLTQAVIKACETQHGAHVLA